MSWLKIGANSGYVIVATAALSLLQWVIMAMIARREGSTVLGEYALSQAFVIPASYFAWLSIRQQLIVSRTENAEPSDFMFLRVFVPLIVFMILLLFIGGYYRSSGVLMLSVCLFFLKYLEGFFDLAYGYIQKDGNWRLLTCSTAIRSISSCVLFALVYVATGRVNAALGSLVVLWAILFLIYDARQMPQVAWAEVLDVSMLSRRWQMALHLLPLATSNVVMSLVTNSPRLVIESQMGAAELGNFSVVSSFLATGSLIFASIGHALLPSFAASVRSSHAQLFWRQLIGTIIGIVVACAIATGLALLIGRQILGIIYGPAFVDQNELLVVAAISGVPVYGASIVANGCYAANLRHGLLMSQVLALVTVVAGTALMVPWWGNFGAFAAISLSATAQMLFCLVLLALYWHSRKGADSAGKLG